MPDAIENPTEIPHAFARAWMNRDADALAALFEIDAEFVNVTGLWWHTQDAIRKAHAYGLARIFNQSTLRVGAVHTKWLGEDIAVVHARMFLSGQTSVAGVTEPGERRTVFSFVMRKSADRWLCASAQNTEVIPGMETFVVAEEAQLRGVSYQELPD